MSVNRVLLSGRLTANPEHRQTPGGQSVSDFSVAINERWTDKSGKRQERVTFIKVVCWAGLADNTAQFLRKGSSVLIEGKLQTRDWTSKEGEKRSSTEVVADKVEFLDGRKEKESAA